MPCERFPLPGGGVAIVCSRGRRSAPCSVPGCGRPHVALCDFRMPTGKTCDAKLCASHRKPVPGKADTDYCPPHHRARIAQLELELGVAE